MSVGVVSLASMDSSVDIGAPSSGIEDLSIGTEILGPTLIGPSIYVGNLGMSTGISGTKISGLGLDMH